MFNRSFIIILVILFTSCSPDEGKFDCKNINMDVERSGCESGEFALMINVNGGVEPYQFILNEEDTSTLNTFENLSAGSYFIQVIDNDGCQVQTNTIQLGVSLRTNVMPIINRKCARSGCHLDTQEPQMSSTFKVIDASDRIFTQLTEGNMPPNGNISGNEVQTVLAWINCGALDN